MHAALDSAGIEKFCSNTGHEWSVAVRVRLAVEQLAKQDKQGT